MLRSYNAVAIVKGQILLNFRSIKTANVKCYTFVKLQFFIVFCKTLLSHYTCMVTI